MAAQPVVAEEEKAEEEVVHEENEWGKPSHIFVFKLAMFVLR